MGIGSFRQKMFRLLLPLICLWSAHHCQVIPGKTVSNYVLSFFNYTTILKPKLNFIRKYAKCLFLESDKPDVIQMTVKDPFRKNTLYLDYRSVVSLLYQFRASQSPPRWYVVEDGDRTQTKFSVRADNNKAIGRSVVDLVVDRQFKFGTYTVVDRSKNHSIRIPFRLGKKYLSL